MSDSLNYIDIPNFSLINGKKQEISVSYQIYGQPLNTAPIILVNHALTGNSNVMDWWNPVVGSSKILDTKKYTVLSFNIPGNGYEGDVNRLIYNYEDWTLGDVANVFLETLQKLKIDAIHIGIGGSIGGCLLWEMLAIAPKLFNTIIPIAADWKATDWLIANCHVQEKILEQSQNPINLARQHAMTFYRNPKSLGHKFHRQKDRNFKVQEWLNFHGKRLESRFTLPAYKLMNRLLYTTNAARATGDIATVISRSATNIAMIGIDSDLFFLANENRATLKDIDSSRIRYHEINSIHGHDAFLIEYEQLINIIESELNKLQLTEEVGISK